MATHVYQVKVVTGGEEAFGGDTLLNLAKSSSPVRVPLTDYVAQKLINLLADSASGGAGGGGGGSWFELYIDKGEGATAASGTVTFSGAVANGDTVTVAGVTFTAVASNPSTLQFLSGTNTVAAASFAQALNGAAGQLASSGQAPATSQFSGRADLTALFGAVSASVAAGVVTVTARVKAPEANAITLAKVGVNIAVSGATLTGGTVPTVARFE